jgi:hypothetical protein
VKIEETQLGLPTSLYMWNRSLHEEIVDIKKVLHEELDLMIQRTQAAIETQI